MKFFHFECKKTKTTKQWSDTYNEHGNQRTNHSDKHQQRTGTEHKIMNDCDPFELKGWSILHEPMEHEDHQQIQKAEAKGSPGITQGHLIGHITEIVHPIQDVSNKKCKLIGH